MVMLILTDHVSHYQLHALIASKCFNLSLLLAIQRTCSPSNDHSDQHAHNNNKGAFNASPKQCSSIQLIIAQWTRACCSTPVQLSEVVNQHTVLPAPLGLRVCPAVNLSASFDSYERRGAR